MKYEMGQGTGGGYGMCPIRELFRSQHSPPENTNMSENMNNNENNKRENFIFIVLITMQLEKTSIILALTKHVAIAVWKLTLHELYLSVNTCSALKNY